MPDKLDITDKADQPKVSLKVILLTEEAEPEEKTDQENKVEEEEMLVTSKTNSTEINTKNQLNKSLLPSQSSKKLLKNNKNLKNHKNLLWLSTIKARVLTSTPLQSKEKFQSRAKSTLNG